MTETIEIQTTALDLLEVDGFMKRYYLFMIHTEDRRKTYEKLEDEYFEAFKRRKYSSYRSFCVTRRRWLKKYHPNLK